MLYKNRDSIFIGYDEKNNILIKTLFGQRHEFTLMFNNLH